MSVYRRRVQKIGKSTYIITIPTSWARSIGLEPKTEVVMEILPDMSLRVFVPSKLGIGSKSGIYVIDLSPSHTVNDIVREIIGGYIADAKMIKIQFQDYRRDIIDKAISISRERLMGLEIVDEDRNSITLQIVVDPNLSEIDGIIRRMTRLSYSMHIDILSYLDEKYHSPSILESIISRDNLVDKLYLLAMRQLSEILRNPYEMSKKNLSYPEIILLAMYIKNIERIADHATNIAIILMNVNRDEIDQSIITLYRNAIEVFNKISTAFITMDKSVAIQISKAIEELRITEDEIRKKLYYKINPYVARFLDTIARIIARSLDIAEQLIDLYALRHI